MSRHARHWFFGPAQEPADSVTHPTTKGIVVSIILVCFSDPQTQTQALSQVKFQQVYNNASTVYI